MQPQDLTDIKGGQPQEPTGTNIRHIQQQDLTDTEEQQSVGKLGQEENLESSCLLETMNDSGATYNSSTLAFSEPKCNKKLSITKGNLVLTSLSQEEMTFVEEVTNKLGSYAIVNEVDATVTHIVCGLPAYTENVLRGLMSGCWVVSFDWVVKSVENGGWLPEMEFVPARFLQAVTKTKSSIDPWYQCNFFQGVGKIYMMQSVKEVKVYERLVELAGGDITDKPVEADIIVVSRKHQLPKRHRFTVPRGPTFVFSSWVKTSLANLALEQIIDHQKYKS
ncbi:hypothetical protein B566_EDAN002398 [Ephemera danica]|nr:hypothetical protein B566_EDAN002398 [Ephemera danica]